MTDYEGLRQRFRPSVVRVLFVGESRPAGGSFFYAANSNLFFATREAFAAVYDECPNGKAFLEFFQQKGCYLDDLCEEPVNKGRTSGEREREHEKGITSLAERLAEYDPKAVVIVMLGIAPPVRRALQEANRRMVPTYALPFPRPEHKARYVRELTAVLRKLQESGVLERA